MNLFRLARKVHYYISWFILVPFFITTVTGVLLMMRHHVEAIQPTKVKTGHAEISLNLQEITEIVAKIPDIPVKTSSDIGKVVFKPKRGLIEVFVKGNHHIQIDGQSGEVLKVAPRYTSLLIMLHEGIFFHRWVRDGIFLPASILMVVLLITGSFLMYFNLRKTLRRRKEQESD